MAAAKILEGIWTWFNHPVASVASGKMFVGSWPNALQRPQIAMVDLTNGDELVTAMPTGATALGETDDHDNPAVLPLANGELLIAWGEHNGDSFSCTTTNAGDIRSWDSIVTVNTAETDSYFQLMQAGDTSNTIYWFFRRSTVNGRPQHFRTSTDNGATWSTPTEFLRGASGQRPYFRWWKTSGSRVDFFYTQGQPNEVTACSIYHGYMTIASDGTRAYYKSDGTLVGDDTDLPFAHTDFTLVYDGTTNEAWIWDNKTIGGSPCCVFAVFNGGTTSHEYHRGTWNGSAWTTEKICDAGTTGTADYLYATEAYYSGGVCLDPNDEDIVYASREYSATDFRLETWTKSGGTWSKTSDLSGNTSSINARPVAVDHNGTTHVLYWRGTYTSYTVYSANIYHEGSLSLRTAKPASPVAHTIWTPPSSRLILPLQETTNVAPTDLTGNYTPSLTGTVTRTSDTIGYYASGFSTSNYFTINSLAGDFDGETVRWAAVLFSNTSTTTDQWVLSFGRSSSNNPFVGIVVNAGTSGTMGYYQRNDANAGNNATGAGTACNDGNLHVAHVISFSDSIHRLYFDGVLIGSNNNAIGTKTLDRCAVGCLLRGAASNAFAGKVYAVAVGYGGAIPTPAGLYNDWYNGRFSGFEAAEATSLPPMQRRTFFWRAK